MWFRATHNILNFELYVRNVEYLSAQLEMGVVLLHVPFSEEADDKGRSIRTFLNCCELLAALSRWQSDVGRFQL